MSDLISGEQAMAFPNTWKEFEEEYGFTDDDKTYTNGSRLIPSFRVEQWLEHIARPRGEWIDNETSYADGVKQTCTCSVCGRRSHRPLGDYCRWCGADMLWEE